MTSLTLYEHPLSPYAQKVKIALREKGLEFEAKTPGGLGSGARVEDEFVRANPRMEVPVLIDGAASLFDSTIILEYLEERYPEPPLLPEEPVARAGARTIEEVLDTHYEAITWGLSEVRYFRRATGKLAEKLESAAAIELGRLHAWLEDRLGEEAWLGGDGFGWADLCAAPFVNGAHGFGLGPDPESGLFDWLERVNERPGVQETAAEAQAALSDMDDAARLVESGSFKRQYRDHRLEWMIRSGGVDVVAAGLENADIRFTRFP